MSPTAFIHDSCQGMIILVMLTIADADIKFAARHAFVQATAALTMKRALSASCCATCLASTAPVYSLLKVRLVMETSSRYMLKYCARCVRILLISLLTTCTQEVTAAMKTGG